MPLFSKNQIYHVADATARLALLVNNGDEVIQDDDASQWIYDGSAWVQRALNATSIVRHAIQGDMFDTPSGTNWQVNTPAPAAQDSVNNALVIRTFDDTTEQAVGFMALIPGGATSLTLRFQARSQGGAGGGVVPKLYYRSILDGYAPGAWISYTLPTHTLPANTNFQYTSQTVTLSTLGLLANQLYQFELSRDAANGSDTLVGNWVLVNLTIEFNVQNAFQPLILFADNLMSPNQTGWAVTSFALLIVDSISGAIKIRQFDDTTEQGAGIYTAIPSGAGNITLRIKGRASSAGGGGVVWKLYYCEIPNNAALGSWNSRVLGTATIPATTNYFTAAFTFTLASFSPSINTGGVYILELTRDAANVADTLSGIFNVIGLTLEYS